MEWVIALILVMLLPIGLIFGPGGRDKSGKLIPIDLKVGDDSGAPTMPGGGMGGMDY